MMAIAGLQTALPGPVAAQDATAVAEVGVLEAREGLPECAAVDPGVVPAEEAATVYVITSEESMARYRVMEELASVGANEVIGETNAIIGAIVSLANSFRMKITAEGIETAADFERMRDFGCHKLQGYLFGRPMPHTETLRLVGTRYEPRISGN